ncbi:MAG: hypothetical protein WC310_04640 [Patescibacteria group bacterium]
MFSPSFKAVFPRIDVCQVTDGVVLKVVVDTGNTQPDQIRGAKNT